MLWDSGVLRASILQGPRLSPCGGGFGGWGPAACRCCGIRACSIGGLQCPNRPRFAVVALLAGALAVAGVGQSSGQGGSATWARQWRGSVMWPVVSVSVMDWAAWHDDYDDPGSALAGRLAVVQSVIRTALDGCA